MSSVQEYSELTRSFEAHDIDAVSFHHAEHIRVAFDLLQKYDFVDASSIYAKGIQAIATNAGVPRKFNTTITYAFLSLIAQGIAEMEKPGYDWFLTNNTDLFAKNILERWYSPKVLQSDTARKIYLLPIVNLQSIEQV
jgi:hypothetical protein